MGRRADILLICVVLLAACEREVGTPVDPAALGYHPCVAAGDCVAPGAADVMADTAAPDGAEPDGGEPGGAAGPFEGRWAMIETQARLKPRQVDINDILPGGFARIFSGLSLSRILNSGTETTVTLVRTASQIIESLPERIQGRAEIAERLKVVSDLLDGFNTERADTIDPRRAPLRLAVEKATFDLREALEQIDGRLRTPFGRAFIDSLYPDLRRRPNRSEDDQDPLLEDNSDDPTP